METTDPGGAVPHDAVSYDAAPYDAAAHYDRVTRAWGLLLGDELHYGDFGGGDFGGGDFGGGFASGAEDLATATGRLTARMIAGARLRPGQRVLDVGCGTGAPACRLVREHDVEVLGITTSAVGAAAATERARRVGLSGARFEIRDGTRTGLPDGSFERVWVMESSHLMPDRPALLAECARVLRPGGRLVLCDIVRRRDIPFAELRERRAEFAALRAAFGAARMDPLPTYARLAADAGLTEIDCVDLTAQTLPTFEHWQANLDAHRAEVERDLGAASVADFERSVRILRGFWLDGTLGYGMLSATKLGEQP